MIFDDFHRFCKEIHDFSEFCVQYHRKKMKTEKKQKGRVPKILGRVFCRKKKPLRECPRPPSALKNHEIDEHGPNPERVCSKNPGTYFLTEEKPLRERPRPLKALEHNANR